MEKEKFEKQAELLCKYEKALENLQNLHHEIVDNNIDLMAESRNVKLMFWKEIIKRFKSEDLLNCYGDIFFIEDKTDSAYIGRRVLWNFGLSKETYIIYTTSNFDVDGDYTYTDYEIEVLGEN